MPPRKRLTRTRSSSALLDGAEEAGQAPAVDLSDVKLLVSDVKLLVKAAARQQGIATAAMDMSDVKAALESALATEEEEDEVGEDEDSEEEDGVNGKGMEQVCPSTVVSTGEE